MENTWFVLSDDPVDSIFQRDNMLPFQYCVLFSKVLYVLILSFSYRRNHCLLQQSKFGLLDLPNQQSKTKNILLSSLMADVPII